MSFLDLWKEVEKETQVGDRRHSNLCELNASGEIVSKHPRRELFLEISDGYVIPKHCDLVIPLNQRRRLWNKLTCLWQKLTRRPQEA